MRNLSASCGAPSAIVLDPLAKSVRMEVAFWMASRTLARSSPSQPSAPGKWHLSGSGGWSPAGLM
jgi:hypothetical protein